MSQKVISPLVSLLVFMLCGCSTVNPGMRFGDAQLATMKSAYVVRHPKSTRDIDGYIQEALAERGVRVSSGLIESKPKDVDFYVEYVDRWQWDLTMYLLSLDIRFKSNADGALIASGSFEQGTFHGFPDPKKTTKQVIERIYGAP